MDYFEEGNCDHYMEAMHFLMLCEQEQENKQGANREEITDNNNCNDNNHLSSSCGYF